MPYVGNNPAANFASVTKDTFSGDGSTTAFTLSKAATTNGVAVFVENVRQEPTTAYAVSGTTLTFTAAPVSASGNNIYVLHHNAPASTANHPAGQSLTAVNGTFSGDVSVGDDVSLASDSAVLNFGADGDVNFTHVADKGLTLAVGGQTSSNFGTASTAADNFIVGGTGNVGISILTDANQNARLNFGDVDDTDNCQINVNNDNQSMTLVANGNDAIKIDANGLILKPLQCMFDVNATASQTINSSTVTKITFDTENADINSDFDLSNNKFIAPVAGKYLLQAYLTFADMVAGAGIGLLWYKEGSVYRTGYHQSTEINITHSISSTVIFNLAALDEIEIYAFQGGSGSKTIGNATNVGSVSADNSNYWSGFLLG